MGAVAVVVIGGGLAPHVVLERHHSTGQVLVVGVDAGVDDRGGETGTGQARHLELGRGDTEGGLRRLVVGPDLGVVLDVDDIGPPGRRQHLALAHRGRERLDDREAVAHLEVALLGAEAIDPALGGRPGQGDDHRDHVLGVQRLEDGLEVVEELVAVAVGLHRGPMVGRAARIGGRGGRRRRREQGQHHRQNGQEPARLPHFNPTDARMCDFSSQYR